MITKKTVLVLGAGASMPFGFPSGRELVKKICLMLRGGTEEFDILENHGYDRDYILEFRDTLAKSGQTSVDAFLQHGHEYVDVGKEAIAAALLPHEKTVMLFDVPRNKAIPNWYELLFAELNTSFEEFDKNKLSIVTFNYDRSIEHYLFTAFKNTHHKKKEECAQKLGAINIVHLYGKFGDLPWQNTGFSTVPYEATSDQKQYGLMVGRGGKNIKIIHEDIEKDPEFDQAFELLIAAKHIYFLGFGFDETNLKRLRIESLCHPDVSNKVICGTSHGLSQRQNQLVKGYRKTPNRLIDLYPQKIYDFLYNNPNANLG